MLEVMYQCPGLVQLYTIPSHRCQNDVINGWFRVECKISRLQDSFSLFNQTVQSNSITLAALVLAVGAAHKIFQVSSQQLMHGSPKAAATPQNM